MKSKYLLHAVRLLILMALLFPVNFTGALAAPPPPPVDMFQLPWDQGIAWVAIDGLDNGTKRPLSSSHHYTVGGAIDFAPRSNMIKGENTSNFWVAAAASGTVVGISGCHVTIAHGNGWITEYQFLANIQVKLGDPVSRNQRLGIIADGVRHKFCPGSLEPNVPHVHFMLRPSLIGASFAGWVVGYTPAINLTTFTKNGQTVGLFKPLLNVFDSTPTPTPTQTTTSTPVSETPSASATPSPTQEMSPTPTLFGPFVSATITPQSINVDETALVTVRLNNVPAEGYTSAEFTCSYNAGLFEVSNITIGSLFGTDPATAIHGPQSQSLIVAIAGSSGNKATTSGTVFTFDVKGLQAGQTVIECRARVSTGNNVLTEIPFALDYLTILGSTPTPNLTPSDTPTSTQSPGPLTPTVSATPTPSQIETSTPGGGPIFTATPTPFANDWLTFTNSTYGFEFKYPPQGVIADGKTDNFARIDLPFVQGTNLREKYLEVIVRENVNPCLSPLQTPNPPETVTINGITFLKQTGQDAGVGHLHQWIAYSTLRDNVCVSLDFILHSLNPGNFSTPPPAFDFDEESAAFEQIVSTYTWLSLPPTATPTFTAATPVDSPTPTASPTETSAPIGSPTATLPPSGSGTLTGQVIARKPVTVGLYDATDTLVTSVTVNVDGTFSLTAPAGTYTVRASASGFLSAEGSVTLTGGSTSTMPTVTLSAGDIDGNNAIDQFDALTIGMNYNGSTPAAADLNNDGVINVLDLEVLANNYRDTGPTVWE